MADALEIAEKFLEDLERHDLSTLISQCSIAIRTSKGGMVDDDWYPNLHNKHATVLALRPIDKALRLLPDYDRKHIAQAIARGYEDTSDFDDISVETVKQDVNGVPRLLAELIIQRETMIDVATGGQRIQEVNDFYRAREIRLRRNLPEEIPYNNPHDDLWNWYHFWDENLPQWKDRRRYVREMFGPVIEALTGRAKSPILERELSGWERVDRTLSKARNGLAVSENEEDFQAVGLLCREVLISLAQAVFDPDTHEQIDEVKPGKADARRMLEAYIEHELSGTSNKQARRHAKASLDLAVHLQHMRTADRRHAALCLEGTASTVAVISILDRSEWAQTNESKQA